MSQLNNNYVNPFDDVSLPFTVLRNHQQQYSLWPQFAAQPAGWSLCFGPASQQQCIEWVEQHWQDIRPMASPAVTTSEQAPL
ncbi:MbtH family protein [Oceanobacter mangrovi]|uniref:MbtH family protein n=1 Tax=Oceanobacter mangrovi TaxID=2862510 RepID=UPI001C8EA5B4|nr:MbtH family protein [Oceanobacter mangrovi]